MTLKFVVVLILCLTEQEQERDQEKWKRILCEIEKSLKSEKYSAALQLVDKFLTDCKSPDSSFQALMKKAQTCLDAWKSIRKLNSIHRVLSFFFIDTIKRHGAKYMIQFSGLRLDGRWWTKLTILLISKHFWLENGWAQLCNIDIMACWILVINSCLYSTLFSQLNKLYLTVVKKHCSKSTFLAKLRNGVRIEHFLAKQ